MPEQPLLPRDPNILLVAPPTTATGDLDSYTATNFYERAGHDPRLPPLGIPPLHGALEAAGYHNVTSVDLRFGTPQAAAKFMVEQAADYDVGLFTAITVNSGPAARLASLYKERNPEGVSIGGGPHFTALADETLARTTDGRHPFDYVVRGEGDHVAQIVGALQLGNIIEMPGISYRDGSTIVHNDRSPLLTSDQLSKLPHPIYPDTALWRSSVNSAIFSRGCPQNCDFCGVTDFFGRQYRRVANEWAIEELNRLGDINDRRRANGLPSQRLFIADDNFYAGNTAQKLAVRELLEEANELQLIPPGSIIQVRVEAARDETFMELLRQSGIGAVCVGIESVNDDALDEINKRQTRSQIERYIRHYREAGLWVHGMFILGLDSDTPDTIRDTVDWAIGNVHSAQFFAPGPIPGTRLTKRLQDDDRILTNEHSLADGSHVLIRPAQMSPWHLQQEIRQAHRRFYAPHRIGGLALRDALRTHTFRGRGDMLKFDFGLRASELVGHGGLPHDPVTKWYDEQLQHPPEHGLITLPKH